MRRTSRLLAVLGFTLAVLLAALPASADHTDPGTPLSPIEGAPTAGVTRGIGTWDLIANFPANPGTDLKLFTIGKDIYASTGTLGQASEGHVGQRIIRLTADGVVDPSWVADHGSAHCATENPSGTLGLQHDVVVAPRSNPKVLVDATDALGRCHDKAGGGMEIVDISGLGQPGFEPREIHLIAHRGFTHTLTTDAERPWIVYNSSSDFTGGPWLDIADIRSCMSSSTVPLAEKRDTCRPKVYRIPFKTEWTQIRKWNTGQVFGQPAACHDITARPGRIYCAALNATLIFDVSNLVDPVTGDIRGTPLPCTVRNGDASTTAKVTDCSAFGAGRPEAAEGWQFLGGFNHPGRDCLPPELPYNTNCNSNNNVRSDDGVSVSHEADPSQNGRFLFVTDERGGGVVPPGSSCEPGIDNPFGNGGMHVFDISDPANMRYASTPDGRKAVYISDAIVPAATFCDIHVIEAVHGEQRVIAAYYSQGTKIVDYRIDKNGAWTFTEVASLTLPGANTWAVQHFKVVKNADGTRTYYFLAVDIQRGIDVFSWTGPAGPKFGAQDQEDTEPVGDIGIVLAGLVALPVAGLVGRRRRSR